MDRITAIVFSEKVIDVGPTTVPQVKVFTMDDPDGWYSFEGAEHDAIKEFCDDFTA
jgi:hypothetical protein